ERFDVLTGLTFVPLAVICWHHAHDFWQPMQGLLETELTFKHFVTMFFVLSGFVIAFRHNHIKDTATALRFYLDRVAWLWPVHLLCLVSLLFLVPEVFSIKGDQFLPFLSSLFMAQTWIPIAKYYFSFNSPSWTTTTLFAFYAAFPLLLMCARRSKALVLSITAALALGMILVSNSLGLPVDNLTGPSIQGMVYINPLARLLEFTAGIVCALTYLQFAHRIKLSPVFATILEVAALALIAFVNLNSKGWQIQATPLITESGAFWLHHSATSFIPFAIFMTILSTKKGLMAKFFASKTMVFLGKLSFSMFMIHGVVIAFLNVNYRQEQSLTSAVYITAGLLLAAHITHSYFVQPIRRLINKHGQKLIARNFPTPPPSPDRWISAGLDKQNHWLLGIEIVVCAAMIYLAQPTIASVSPEQAATIGATATVKDVHFDPWLKCVSGTARHGNEFVTINTVWQPLKPESIDFFIIARVLDKSNAVLGVKRYSMDGRHQQVSPEQQWLDTVSIAVPADAQPTRVAIKITRGKRKAVAATSNNPSEIDASEMLIPVIAEEVHQIQ
ncbi:MAG: acyltransferase, partial [Candidatus Melainabacteria bacterium]|nr:acyltransferase [Candidatus Melainabacteria bacterium]